jgi:hypothetical protein
MRSSPEPAGGGTASPPAPPPAPAEAPLEHELKFVFPAARGAELLTRLTALTRPDPAHPVGVVQSIYYDTQALDSLYEKIDSHLAKAKYRLRWYEEPGSAPGDDPGFFEVKRRFGTRRAKRRMPVPLSASRLAGAALLDPELAALPAGLWRIGVAPPPGLSPCLTLRYERHRFVDPAGATRLNLDRGIQLTAGDPRRLAPGRRPPLPVAILEVKNLDGRLPRHLDALLPPGWRLASLSKYAVCFLTARGNRQLVPDPL